MDGRWKRWLTSGIIFGLVGCTHSQVVPPALPGNPAPVGMVSNKPVEDNRNKKEGPLSVETIVQFANVRATAALDANRPATERQQLLEQAKNDYQQALQREPKNLNAYGGLAEMYANLGDKEKALEVYRQAAKVMPTNANIYVAMAICCKQFDDRAGAVEYMHAATKINPTDRRLKINLGFELAMTGRYEEGFAWLKATLGEPQAHCGLAQVMDRQGKKEEARQEVQIALQGDPNCQPARDLLAKLSAPDTVATPDTGIKNVGHDEWIPVPEGRLAPNAKLLSQPDPQAGMPVEKKTERKPIPAATMQFPEPMPLNGPSSTTPTLLPSSGWDR